MCSLCGGEGSVGTCLPLASLSRRPPGFCLHPWRVCSPLLAWQVMACAPRREETAGVSLGAAGALVSGHCGKGLTLPLRVWLLSQQC